MTLVEHLIKVREHLSNKERWETNWENNKVTGYASGSLLNTLGGLWDSKNNSNYAAAHDCVARAIKTLFGQLKPTKTKNHIVIDNPVPASHFEIIDAFQERKHHEDMMQVLDLAIRYAKMYTFS